MEVGGVRFRLDPSAVSAIRYRAEYGESAAETGFDGKKLLRLFHIMIVPEERRSLEELARLARKDKGFMRKTLEARDALMADDPLRPTGEEGAREPFDEYQVLALMMAAGVEASLIYELPILHLVSVVQRAFEMKSPSEDYHEMTPEELRELYPR